MSQSAEFRLEMTASAEAIDELGHVSNIAYVAWIQEVATSHSAAVGLARGDYERMGAIWVVRKHEVEYLRPAMEGDALTLVTHVAWWRGATCERQTRIVRTADDMTLCEAKTLWAYVSTSSGRPRRIPPEISRAFATASPG